MTGKVKIVNANVRSTPTEFVVTVKDFENSFYAVLGAYDALERAVHQQMALPPRPLPELIGYMRSQLGLSETITVDGHLPPPPAGGLL